MCLLSEGPQCEINLSVSLRLQLSISEQLRSVCRAGSLLSSGLVSPTNIPVKMSGACRRILRGGKASGLGRPSEREGSCSLPPPSTYPSDGGENGQLRMFMSLFSLLFNYNDTSGN